MQVSFWSGDLLLEGDVAVARGSTEGAVICHPHPIYGGTMNNPVVRALARATYAAGLVTLRFNFRSAGRSAGVYGDGIGEIADARAATRFLVSEARVKRVVMIGYSFGAMVGLQAGAPLDEVRQLVGIAPPVESFDLRCLAGCTKPKLFVVGDTDEFCPVRELRRRLAAVPEPKREHIVAGAGHFLAGYEDAVAAAVCAFIADTSGAPRG